MRIQWFKGNRSFKLVARIFMSIPMLWVLNGCEAPGTESPNYPENASGAKGDIANVQNLDLNRVEWVRLLNHNHIPAKVLMMYGGSPGNLAFLQALTNILEEINAEENHLPIKIVLVGAPKPDISNLPISDYAKNNLVEFIPLDVAGNMWLQDFGEIMAVKTHDDTQEKLLLFDSNRGRGLADLAATLADLWDGYYYQNPDPSDGGDDGGDIEVTPNNILYVGTRSSDGLRNFFGRYGYQDRLVLMETEWLRIGHVDEFISTIMLPGDPCGFGLVKADPLLGVDLLKKAASAELEELVGLPYTTEQEDFSMMQKLHQYLLTDEDDPDGWRAWAQRIAKRQATVAKAIDNNVAKLKAKIIEVSPQCSDLKVISFPVMFNNGIAILPNPVNMTVLREHQVISDPFFKPYREYIENELRQHNQNPHFINDLDYHTEWGEVHCGTNVLRLMDQVLVK